VKITKKRKSTATDEEPTTKKLKFDITAEELDVLRVHTDFKCEKCSEQLNDWKEIRTHYRQRHKICGYLRCCGRKIDRANEVKDHASVSIDVDLVIIWRFRSKS